MKILSAQQNKEADAFTIKHDNISSSELMEKAAGACFEWIKEELNIEKSTVHIFCGVGNNGGDGLVLARLLAEHGNNVHVYIICFSDKRSNDFELNYGRLNQKKIKLFELTGGDLSIDFGAEDLIIDAIFGTGLNKPVTGWVKELIKKINFLPLFTVSIDMPSGLFAEYNDENDMHSIVEADITLTFQQPKLALVLPEGGNYCGNWHVIDIGLNENFIEEIESEFHTIDESDVWMELKERQKFDHKGSYGHVMIMAGSYGKIGAAVLAGRACLRIGTGLITALIPECGYEIYQTSIPEAMCYVSSGRRFISDFPEDISKFNAIGIGPGIGTETETIGFFEVLLSVVKIPLVLDADALNILSKHKMMLSILPENTILTPHPGEFKRLVGEWKNDREKLKKMMDFSKKYKVIIVLKGAHTTISTPDGEIYFNTSGNPGMATAGSGDVLLGMITGLLGRGYSPENAAKIGVYLHGLAGDLAADTMGMESMIAGDIVEHISKAYLSIE